MAKIELSDITSGYNLSKVNENFQKIEDALNDEVLYRDNPVGEDNALQTDIDANNKRILNLPDPVSASEPIRKQEWDQVLPVAEQYKEDAEQAADEAESWATIAENSSRDGGAVRVDSIKDLATFVVAEEGQQFLVTGYHEGTSVGGGLFVWTTGRHNGGTFIDPNRAFPTDWSDQSQLSDWFTDSGSDVAGFKRLRSNPVSVLYFGAKGDSATDDTKAIQNAVYETGKFSIILYRLLFPSGKYLITSPILFYSKDGLRIEGDGKVASVIVPSGAMTPVLDAEFTALQALGYDDYTAVPCCFLFSTVRETGPNEVWVENKANGQWHNEVDGIGFIGDATTRDNVVGIYGPVMASARFDNILYKNLLHGFKSEIFWRTNMRNCDFTWLNGTPVSMEDSATRGATGTSVNLTNCGSYYTRGGFYLRKCHYSTLTNCAVDHWVTNVVEDGTVQTYAYQFDGCKGMVLNGCGAEDGIPAFTKGIFNLFGEDGSTVINGGSFAITDTPAPVEVSRMADDHKLRMNMPLYKNNPNSLYGSYFQVESGQLIVDELVDSNVYSTVFQFGSTASFYAGRQSVGFLARNTASVAMVPSTTSNINFGALDAGQSPYSYLSFDDSTDVFTAPFAGNYQVDITVRFLGSGVETVRTYVNGVQYDIEPNFLPNTTNVQTYTFSANLRLGKGSTVYSTLQTTSGATGSTTFAQMSVKQVS